MNKLLFTTLLCISLPSLSYAASSSSSSSALSRHRSCYPASWYQAHSLAKARKGLRRDWLKKRRGSFDDMLAVNGILTYNNFPPYSRRAIMTALAERKMARGKGK